MLSISANHPVLTPCRLGTRAPEGLVGEGQQSGSGPVGALSCKNKRHEAANPGYPTPRR